MAQRFYLIAGILSQIANLLFAGFACAQPAWDVNKAISIRDDYQKQTITVLTSKITPLPAPRISYLPADNGETILVADFAGLAWRLPPHILQAGENKQDWHGIQEVRLGCLQEYPPICRVSIRTKNPRLLSSVSFNALGGKFSVSWGFNQKSAVTQAVPQSRRVAFVATTPLSSPNIASEKSESIVTSSTAPEKSGKAELPFARQADNENSDRILIGVTQDDKQKSLLLKLQADHPLEYNAFRLHNPERYVIDFSDLSELAHASLPSFSNGLLKAMRVGQLDAGGKTRLVLDLGDPAIAINAQKCDSQPDLLTVTLSDGQDVADMDQRLLLKSAPQKIPAETVIVLDPGHGGSDPGAMRGNVQEKEITLAIIDKLERLLQSRGAKVILTRTDDSFVSLEERVAVTNRIKPDLFLSVHINAMESATHICGIETYYENDESRALAETIHESLVNGLDAPDRAVRKARFYVINHTPIPAVLAEVGFISNPEERDKLISADYQTKIAQALADGVNLYLDKRIAKNKSGEQLATIDHERQSN